MPRWMRIDTGDGSSYPPHFGDRLHEVEHVLRHGNPTREDMLLAASTIDGYCSLVRATAKRRSVIVRALRNAEKKR